MLTFLSLVLLAASPADELPVPIHFNPAHTTNAINCPVGYHRVCENNCDPLRPPCGKPTCECIQDPPQTQTGTVTPSFYVLYVAYTPPGVRTTVSYTSSSVLGTTTSTTNTWKNTTTVSTDIGWTLVGGSIDISASRAFGSTRTDQSDITVTNSNGITKAGVADTIDHSYDQIYFLVSPLIDLKYTPASTYGPATLIWDFDPNQPMSSYIYWSYAGWLANPSTMPSSVKDVLDANGITPDYYPELLKADPFASGAPSNPSLDPARFQFVTTLPYEPVAFQGQQPTTELYGLNRAVTNSSNTSVTTDYSVSVKATVGVIFTHTSIEDKVDWSASTSAKISQGTTQGESIALTQPAFGYSGPTLVRVYIDKIWKTYFFSQDYF